MEREVSLSVTLSATLILIAALLGIVSYTIAVGDIVRISVLEEAVNIENTVSSSQLAGLVGDKKIIPKAAAYSIMLQSQNGIHTLTYNGVQSDINFPASILAQNITGKVTVLVEEVDSGYYDIIIEDFV